MILQIEAPASAQSQVQTGCHQTLPDGSTPAGNRQRLLNQMQTMMDSGVPADQAYSAAVGSWLTLLLADRKTTNIFLEAIKTKVTITTAPRELSFSPAELCSEQRGRFRLPKTLSIRPTIHINRRGELHSALPRHLVMIRTITVPLWLELIAHEVSSAAPVASHGRRYLVGVMWQRAYRRNSTNRLTRCSSCRCVSKIPIWGRGRWCWLLRCLIPSAGSCQSKVFVFGFAS